VLYRRTRGALVVAVSLGTGLVLQGVVVLTARDTAESSLSNSISALLHGLGSRVFGVFLLGAKGVDATWGASSPIVFVGAPLLVGLLFGLALLGVRRCNQVVAVIFTVLAATFFVLPVWGRGTVLIDLRPVFGVNPSLQSGVSLRFSVVPIILVASGFAILLAPTDGYRHPRARRVGRWVFAVQVCVVALVGFSVRNYRGNNFVWRRAVDSVYVNSCHRQPSNRLVRVPTTLGLFWVTLPCKDLAP